ncbi:MULTISPECIES: alpha/beta fold hydrolase [unclassified Halorubrum]|uniref:alpha/beta fold hydrolase n=1 Tax=unclassified Halorubrum TaxID=2642239 RepID=UPI000B986920|nr:MULTISPECIES: alpha/beta hydrolase [unclassified Halorubrum]OYR45608.1 alpha/beta hydrolase [Halorubrum sp. Eb13]OYR55990.1 alpha/beta hydrolase [Halorubrum sp. Ea1]
MTTTYADWTDAQERTTVAVDDHEVEMAYRDEGTGDPVVFLHGIPTNSYLFRDQFEAIATERRAIAPDMIGYGGSAMRDGFDRSIRAQELAVRGLVDELGFDAIDFVGHDLGGGVGLRYAVRTPDAVDRLVLSNSVAYDSWPIGTITDLGLPETARETSVEELQGMLDALFRDTLLGDDHDEAFLEGMTAPWASEEGVTSVVRNASATNTSHTTEIDPRDVTADTLLLWGTEDEFQPIEWAERLEADIDSCELVGLEANHWVPEDRPAAFTEHLTDFLS